MLLIISHIDIDNSNYNSNFYVTTFLLYLLSSIWEFWFLRMQRILSVVKNLPAKARDTSLIPGLGQSHIPQGNKAQAPQLSHLCARAWELRLLGPRAATTEACVPQSPRSRAWELRLLGPRAATTEACVPQSPRSATRVAIAKRSPHIETGE